MGKERVTVEVDQDIMDRLRKAGLDPQTYLERMLRHKALASETNSQREAREAALRAECQPGIDAYDAFIEEHGLWSDGLRQF